MVLVKAHGMGATAQHFGFNAVKSFRSPMIAKAKDSPRISFISQEVVADEVRQIP
jgi:hypothetical protein